jgi:hypothetical protein
MSDAIKSIVSGYVTLKDRIALEDLRAHRERLKKELQDRPKGWIDVSSAIRTLDEDLQVIQEAISRL